MREQTVEFETTYGGITARLERAGGLPMADAMRIMHVVRAYVRNCMESGCEDDLLIAMERAGLGDLSEALLAIGRR